MKSLRSLSQCIPKRETLNTNQNLRYHKEAAYFHKSVKEDHQANHIVKNQKIEEANCRLLYHENINIYGSTWSVYSRFEHETAQIDKPITFCIIGTIRF